MAWKAVRLVIIPIDEYYLPVGNLVDGKELMGPDNRSR